MCLIKGCKEQCGIIVFHLSPTKKTGSTRDKRCNVFHFNFRYAFSSENACSYRPTVVKVHTFERLCKKR